MQKLKAISLLFILGMMIFPWRLVCFTHPFGHSHEHHNHDKPSPCELHRLAAQHGGQHVLPPMHCKYSSFESDNFQTTEQIKFKPTYQTIAFAAILSEIIKINFPEESYIIPPEPRCRSATIISFTSLRAPPFC